MLVTVICPVFNEEKYIDKCIRSIIAQDYPKDNLEIIFVDGMSDDHSREIIGRYAAEYPCIKLVDNPKRFVPAALNIAIDASHGDIIIRIDAHASYPANYISALVEAHNRISADNIGAVCRTDVFNRTPKSLAIKEILAHPLGVGNSTFRTGVEKETEVDTVPFGCWRREAFLKFGKFDERLIRNQDIEFSKRIIRGGGRIIIIPETYCTYFARETFSKLAKNNFDNGKWNILTVWFTRQFSSLSLRHFIPLLFLLSLILPAVAGIFWHPLCWIAVASFVMYSLTVILISAHIAIKKHLKFLYLVATFFVLHISYGLGSLTGLIKIPFIKC